MPDERRAMLYRGKKKFLTFPTNKTDAGFYLASPPFTAIESESPAEIGAAVRAALGHYRARVPTPQRDDYAKLSSPRLLAAGVRSEAAYTRDAKVVGVTQADRFMLCPYQNGGPFGANRGFQQLSTKQLIAPILADDTALGLACLEALALCE